MYQQGMATTGVANILRETGHAEELVSNVTGVPMHVAYSHLHEEAERAAPYKPPPPKTAPVRKFAAAGTVVQAEKAAPAVVFALPKIHGRPPTPPQETKTAEQLAVEKLAPGRSSPPGSLQMCCYLCR